MKKKYLAVLDNNEKARVFILPLTGRKDLDDECEELAHRRGFDMDKVEWMAGGMDININI
jgi:hypothetical protein